MKKTLKLLTMPKRVDGKIVEGSMYYAFDLMAERAIDDGDSEEGTPGAEFTVFSTPWKFADCGTIQKREQFLRELFEIEG